MTTPLLAARGISKSFGPIQVLDGIEFEVNAGRNIALCGENGAGKSTLIKLMTGVYHPTAGHVEVDGKPVVFPNPKVAIDAGIAVVHQEFSTLSALTVSENIFLEKEPRTRLGFIDRRRLKADAETLLADLGIDLDPGRTLDRLSVAECQMVEIAKALRTEARVLILDEPTAVLSSRETEHLFRILAGLIDRGMGLVYVSHRLDEVFEICTDITVIKDGGVTSSGTIADYDHDKVVAAMVGRDLGDLFPPKATAALPQPPALAVKGLVVESGLPPVDLEVRPGEIVALAGLVGSGRTELALAIFGAAQAQGEVQFLGESLPRRSPGSSLARGLAMLTESRKTDGLFPGASVGWNFAATSLGKDAQPYALSPANEERRAHSVVERFAVVVDDTGQPIDSLSGGNQQKVLIGRLLENAPKVLILDEPTRGVDVGAKAEIYRTLRALAEAGVAILMISSELIEVVGLADRVLVMRDGGIAAHLTGADITEDAIITAAAAGDAAGASLDRDPANV